MSAQKKVVEICEEHGYGQVMQITSQEWDKKAKSIDLEGSHFVIGPCGSQVEPCKCTQQNCQWCCGSQWLTRHVKSLKTASELNDESLVRRLTKLVTKMESVRDISLDAEMMVQRAEGDLMRLINSTSLNLSDIKSRTKTNSE